MVRTIIIVVLALMGIFIHPFAPGTVDFIYRFLTFAVLTYLVYLNYRNEQEEAVDPEPIVQYSPPPPPKELEEILQNSNQLLNLIQNDSRTESFLKAQYDIIQGILMAENGGIFYKSDQAAMRKIHFQSQNNISISNDLLPITGLIQLLENDEKVLIENNLSGDKQLLNYYQDKDYNPASFLGIPVIIEGDDRLFFVFDSSNKEHFNHDDSAILEKIRENTKIFLINRLKAYSLLTTLKTNDRLLDFVTALNASKTISIATVKLAEFMSKEFEASRLTISVLKPETNTAVIKKIIGLKDEYDENFEFPLDQGLTGWVIDKNKPYLIDDLEKGEYFIPRYTKDEKSNFGLRSFLGIPIATAERVYGALTLEHTVPGKYSEADKERIKNIMSYYSSTFLRQQ